jgi:hypothetical protein
MNRRKFIVKGLIGAGIIGFGGGYWWLYSGPGREKLSIAHTIQFLKGLNSSELQSTGDWSVSEIFIHLAQSIEYSMSGYPSHKSDTFKNTAGTLAFKVFSQRGEMTHSLNEEIPGAPKLNESDIETAKNRLLESLTTFQEFQNDLQPHFAYGQLSKQEYSWAHVMHIQNHFQEIIIDGVS